MLNERLKNINCNLMNFISIKQDFPILNDKVMNFSFDIEACAINNKTEMLTYSIALMSCDNDSDVCYWYNDVSKFMDMLLKTPCKCINLYAHNCLYDVKPFLLDFVKRYGNNEYVGETFKKREFNKFENEYEVLEHQSKDKENSKLNPFEYRLLMKKGVFYKLTIASEFGEINFWDTFKIVPFSLKKGCKEFLNLELGKDGLDYEKERTLDEELTQEEFKYIYEDVFALSYLVKLLKIDGMEIEGKNVKFTEMTGSGQALMEYKYTLLQDYENRTNSFANENVYEMVDNKLQRTKFFTLKENQIKMKANMLFEALYPIQSYFTDAWQRHSYYGGLSTVEYDNVAKFSKRKNKHGVVLDVNSLYPFIMSSRLLPFGSMNYKPIPYKRMDKSYQKQFPLYIQDITIYDMEVKKNKMAFMQVKDNKDFNGRECLKNNIKNGKKVTLHFRLTNVLLDLLFECYDVKAYKLGGHMSFQGANNLFKTYLDLWSKVKMESKGAKRQFAKLMQNQLYGKFGMAGVNELTKFQNNDGVFTIEHTHQEVVSDTIYLPMATFITSYAKQYLVQAINSNYDRFMYCDTDSLHLFGTLEEVKGVKIGSKIYGLWDNEMTFDDFVYIGSKRYAERNIENGKWEIKCCGLSDSIMKQVDDITTFGLCEHTQKELDKMKLYTNDNDVYYYYDKECTKKIKGLYKSKKSKIIKGGTIIQEQPYKIGLNYYL